MNEGGIVRGGFVEAGICEAVDKPQSQRMTLLLILMNSRDIVKLIDLDCACVLPHYLNRKHI